MKKKKKRKTQTITVAYVYKLEYAHEEHLEHMIDDLINEGPIFSSLIGGGGVTGGGSESFSYSCVRRGGGTVVNDGFEQ